MKPSAPPRSTSRGGATTSRSHAPHLRQGVAGKRGSRFPAFGVAVTMACFQPREVIEWPDPTSAARTASTRGISAQTAPTGRRLTMTAVAPLATRSAITARRSSVRATAPSTNGDGPAARRRPDLRPAPSCVRVAPSPGGPDEVTGKERQLALARCPSMSPRLGGHRRARWLTDFGDARRATTVVRLDVESRAPSTSPWPCRSPSPELLGRARVTGVAECWPSLRWTRCPPGDPRLRRASSRPGVYVARARRWA